MSEKKKKAWFTFSLTPEERAAFEVKFKMSACRSRNDYFRRILLSQPVTIKHRNSSVDDYIREMLAFKKELQALTGNGSQQDTHALHEKIDAILLYVEKQYRLWSLT